MLKIKELVSLPYPELANHLAQLTHETIRADLALRGNFLTPDLREATDTYLLRGGKCLRPILLILSALAAGAKNVEKLLQAGAAVEYYHTATLVHDDIIDHDELRRGQATSHTLIARHAPERHPRLNARQAADFGVSTALLAGDLLFSRSTLLFTTLPGYPKAVVQSILAYQNAILIPYLLQGEQLDVELELLPIEEVSQPDVEQMMRLKTGALLGFAARAGAALGSRQTIEKSPIAETLGQAAEAAGVAFQLQDDILGLFGDEKQLGKPIGSDLREGKCTTLMLHAWSKATAAERKRMKQVLGNPAISTAEIDEMRELVTRTGALEATRNYAAQLAAQAESACQAVADPTLRSHLLAWFDSLVHRSR